MKEIEYQRPVMRDSQIIHVRMKNELAEELTRLAKKADVTRTRMINNLVEVGIDELKQTEQLGVFAFAKVMRDWKESIKQGKLRLKYKTA